MNGSAPSATRAERLVPAVVTSDAGPGLIETPLRLHNWLGFLGSWSLLTFGAALLFHGSLQIMAVGGFCAEGGPYEIAVHCPATSGAQITVGLPLVAAGVLLGIFGARGFGPPAHGYFWTILFGLEGVAFLLSAFAVPDGVSIAWLICGVLFLAMAIPPLFLIRMGWPRSVFGRRRLDGRSLVKHGLPVGNAIVLASLWLLTACLGGSAAFLISSTIL